MRKIGAMYHGQGTPILKEMLLEVEQGNEEPPQQSIDYPGVWISFPISD